MSTLRLIGLACAAAELQDRETLGATIEGLNPEEAEALLEVVAARMELHALHTGDWRPWAEIQWYARLPVLREAAAGFRARLDAEANRHSEWEQRMKRAETELAERGLRNAVAPLIRHGASKTAIEDAASAYAEPLGWNRVFGVLVEELDRLRQSRRIRHG